MKNQFYSNVRTPSLLFILTVLLAVFAVAGCDLIQSDDEEDSSQPFDGSIYYPFDSGSSWSFSDSSQGNLYGYQMSVYEEEEYIGETFSLVGYTTYEYGPPQCMTGWFRFSHDTLFVLNPEALSNPTEFSGQVSIPLMILNPSRSGEEIEVNLWEDEYYGSSRMQTMGTIRSILTPAGLYEDCLLVDQFAYVKAEQAERRLCSLVLAPNTGPVLMIVYNREDEPDDNTWLWKLTNPESEAGQ